MAKRPLPAPKQASRKLAAKTISPSAAMTADQGEAGRRTSQPDGRKGILVRANPEAWKELKRVAIDQERTLQDVMTEAINDVLQKYGKPPVA
ncbi:ribbon-helix-helix domain-containing protein [Microvirga sp. M2]|uniref:ribbon-helix-helix domain-containing protein n=1 Tax=Microvirga sp. M2 TaxID=3073270 RepID=UPI0039C054E0